MPSTNSQAHGDESATDFPVEDIGTFPLLRNCGERERLRERGFGVTNYEWVKGALGTRLMVALTRQDGSELRLRVASSSSSPFVDPQLSADGYSIAYVGDEERFLLPISVGEPKQIAFATHETGKGVLEVDSSLPLLLSYGSLRHMNLLNTLHRKRWRETTGFWWSSDSQSIAFAEVDATGIPPFLIMYQGESKLGGEAEEDHVYPFAGHPNVKTGKRELVVVEESNIWVNLHDCFTPLCKGQGRLQGGFNWASEQTGFHSPHREVPTSEVVKITASDGTELHGAVYRSDAGQFGQPPSQALVSVYEGPNAQTICNSWMNTVDICMLNIFGAELDNRGSDRRGLMFYRAVKHKLGKVDVSGPRGSAPVTAWDGYNTHYTEKYMGSPASNSVRFEQSSVMYHVHQITGKLLLVHGMIDENVHFHHTA
ncbi:unnamed protein product [Sphagnum troendelagicum]|uniref:Uncharacterized protein n=1 Tax=Sphagnum troendelagicum TaxID=128251 RepID=A0ABP0UY25_9BRYO